MGNIRDTQHSGPAALIHFTFECGGARGADTLGRGPNSVLLPPEEHCEAGLSHLPGLQGGR